MTFYHGTSKEAWEKIQQEGVLYGRRFIVDDEGNVIKEVNRCTYLAVDVEEAMHYGDIILKVEYDAISHRKKNNYIEGCWQIRVYEPIPLSQVHVLKIEKRK